MITFVQQDAKKCTFFNLFNLSHSLKGVISWSNAKFSKFTWWELYIDSKENCYWDHKSEMIKLVGTTCKKLVLEGKHYWVHCSLAKCNLLSFKCQNMIFHIYLWSYLSRWWQTISMSKCSSIVFLVNGLVGLVDDGITFASEHTLMISGAWPPPAPSEW